MMTSFLFSPSDSVLKHSPPSPPTVDEEFSLFTSSALQTVGEVHGEIAPS